MEPEVALSCSQDLDSRPYPERHAFHPRPSLTFLKIHFRITLLSTPSDLLPTGNWTKRKTTLCISLFPHTCYMPCQFLG